MSKIDLLSFKLEPTHFILLIKHNLFYISVITDSALALLEYINR
jgi:hypothetical protein